MIRESLAAALALRLLPGPSGRCPVGNFKKSLAAALTLCLLPVFTASASHAGADAPQGVNHPVYSYIYSHAPEPAAGAGPLALPPRLSWADSEGSHTPAFDVPVVMNERVERFIRYFQTDGRGYFAIWLERSSAYLPMIKEMLAAEGLPEDLAYLPLIESGYSTHARSRAKAVGMWQFMRWTGKKYGLRVDWWVDERRDPEKATAAAASYLSYLYNMFDSWYLAAASYNAGEGRVSRAIRTHNTRDFWELASQRRALHAETRNYIPKYIAAMVIAKSPEKYGFTGLNYMKPLSYDRVTVDYPTDINVIARASGTTATEIRRLNPELLRWFTPPGYSKYEVKIPSGAAERFYENISRIPVPEMVNFQTHRLRKGETLWDIARRYGTSVRPIMHLNEIKNPKRLRPGTVIVVPVRGGKGRGTKVASARAAKKTKPGSGAYTVRRGDTIWDIGVKFGVDARHIIELNELPNSGLIKPGQTIYLKRVMLEKDDRESRLN